MYDKEFENENVFTIKDPFDKPHNPGRAKLVHKTFLVDQFKYGYNALRELTRKSRKEERVNFLSSVFEKSSN
jgi:hypothetical protein